MGGPGRDGNEVVVDAVCLELVSAVSLINRENTGKLTALMAPHAAAVPIFG